MFRATLLLLLCVTFSFATLNLVKFSPTAAQATGAVCNDGTPAAYYIQTGTVNNFIIYLQGGALCFNQETCAPRVGTGLASSLNYTATAFQVIPTRTQWQNWNLVQIQYCSSDLYSGTQRNATSFGFIFAGNFILKAIIQDLINNYGLSNSSQVIFWGDSAGAVGVINNIDLLQSFIPGARVQGVANSGWFLNHTTFAGTPTIAQIGALTSPEYGARLNTACFAANIGPCYLTPNVYPFIKQKMFFIQSFIDEFEIAVELGFNNFTAPTSDAFIEDVASLYKTDLAQFETKPGDDYYLLTCFLHVPDITYPFIKNTTAVDAVVNWYFNGVSSHLGDKCNVHNATLQLLQNPGVSCPTVINTCLQDAYALPPLTTTAPATTTTATTAAKNSATLLSYQALLVFFLLVALLV